MESKQGWWGKIRCCLLCKNRLYLQSDYSCKRNTFGLFRLPHRRPQPLNILIRYFLNSLFQSNSPIACASRALPPNGHPSSNDARLRWRDSSDASDASPKSEATPSAVSLLFLIHKIRNCKTYCINQILVQNFANILYTPDRIIKSMKIYIMLFLISIIMIGKKIVNICMFHWISQSYLLPK